MRYEVSVSIKAPVDVVWKTIADLTRWPEWTPTVTAVDLSNQDGLRVGDTVAVVQPGQRDRTWTVTEVTEGSSFVWEATDPGGLRLRAGHTATAADDATTTAELYFAVNGPMAWLASLLAGRTIRRAVDTEARSLKDWCEKHS